MIFFLSKILWYIFNPFNLMIIFFVVGFYLKLFNFKFFYKIFYLISLLIFIFAGIFPTGSYLNFLLEKKFHSTNNLPEKVDGIIILSGATNPSLSNDHNQTNLNESAERLVEAVYLINQYPQAKIIFAGGSGSIIETEINHAKIAKKFFNDMKIPTERLIFEQKSRNTYENIIFSKKIANPKNSDIWVIISSAFHLNRALNIAEKSKWKLIPYATDFNQPKNFKWYLSINFLSNFSQFQKASHEWIGNFAYYLMGRSSRILY